MATTAAARVHASERDDIENALKRRVSGEVKFDPFTRVLYSTDASIYQMEPVGVNEVSCRQTEVLIEAFHDDQDVVDV